jgi:hypothetical protein
MKATTSEQKKPSDWHSKLSALLLICYDTLDTFGKEPEQLENASKLFAMVLSDFTMQQIESAFKIYLKTNSVMPKPADIVYIIEPPKEKKKWCKVTFLEIKRKKRENVFTTNEENQYCEDFLKVAVSGEPDERLELESAVKQEKLEHQQYWIN